MTPSSSSSSTTDKPLESLGIPQGATFTEAHTPMPLANQQGLPSFETPFTVVAHYHFCVIEDPPAFRERFLTLGRELNLCGSLLVAPEGINGTLAGTHEAVATWVHALSEATGLRASNTKYSYSETQPFLKLKVRLKKEIVTLRQPEANPAKLVGQYVQPKDWNALIQQDDVLVLDTRNTYETDIGVFAGTVDPRIETFTEFVAYVRSELNPQQHKKVAMFCTGGIRCEKASAFMMNEGFEEVYHLQGGILKYLEEVPPEESLWQGDCYVFDRRVAVGHGLEPSNYTQCYSCGYPLKQEDTEHPLYEKGVSCHHCHANTTPEDKTRFRMRQAQINAQHAKNEG
ncbi:MAG: rhodanese-related sulfurtransferase [Vampirovibrionales bacterium]